jgi:methionine-rich copper-binding protein CopC
MARLIAISMFLLLCAASPAFAHASLVEAVPAPDAVVAIGDVSVELRFDSRLDPRFCRMQLLDANGDAVALTQQASASQSMLKAVAAQLPEGAYILRWRILSVDGHANQGDIRFRVGR